MGWTQVFQAPNDGGRGQGDGKTEANHTVKEPLLVLLQQIPLALPSTVMATQRGNLCLGSLTKTTEVTICYLKNFL